MVWRCTGSGDEVVFASPRSVQKIAPSFSTVIAICWASACSAPPRIQYVAPPASLKRLTASQLENTLRDRYGSSVVLPPPIEADVSREDSVIIGTAQSGYSARGVEMSRALAESVAAQVLSDPLRAEIMPCAPAAVRDDTCAATFVSEQGRSLWRRTLDDEEVSRLVAVAGAAATLTGDFHFGLR